MTVVTLESIRCDEHFCLFWDLLKKRAAELDIDDPKLPRRRKQPKRYDENSSTSSFPSTVEEYICLLGVGEKVIKRNTITRN